MEGGFTIALLCTHIVPKRQVGLSPYEMLYGILRESFPRQVDRESRGPQGERGLEFSRRKKGQTFSFSTFLRII